MSKATDRKEKFELIPVRKIFGNEIKYPDGPPDKILHAAQKLGFISEMELELLLEIKHSNAIATTKRNKKILQKLMKMGFLREK
ncbi:MAG: hypothetical protein R6U96_19495 [Promethearchaeia archaeon]